MLRIRNFLAVALTAGLLSCGGVVHAQAPQPTGDAADVATDLARQIMRAILAECPPQCRVAVFPFGNPQGRVSGLEAETAEILRGELIQQLSAAAAGRMFILDRDGLAREFQGAGIDASSVSPQDAAATCRVLQKLGVDIAILGTMNPPLTPSGPTKMQVYVIWQSGGVIQLTCKPEPLWLQSNHAPPTQSLDSRFEVDVLMDGKPLPLQRSTNPDSGYFNAMFLVLPRQMVGREYQLRLTNRGVPPLSPTSGDPQRIFGAVATVDGVNTIYQENGCGQLGPVVLHPKNCQKWLLSGPGQTMIPDPNSPDGFRMEPTAGPGQSVLMIPGFQNGPQFSKAFTFAIVRESVAENLGITNDIGLIAVHFYPEDLGGDQPPLPISEKSLGATRPGRDIANPVFKVRTRLQVNPVEVWRIFYRYEDDASLNQLALQLITG